ncbi:MAG: hypothetical protein D5R99_04750 [Methanocalculus sp. MSAO_Arc1]|uniref:hypothetical protein n=1 Tax=Methanocalculus sp. MSAO_Arc1 TaxID=2293854 RepID=UPI000FF5C674|nr:hypothetical protein [Methanocalculus sp. MSAO_Arc1]RQD80519.1 MAG: hypothetical protein D5R99_04750 [Methanocalculus sp. MSAO_Arc1]
MSAFTCPQCGAPLQVTPRLSYHLCEYCGTHSFIDRSGVIFYYLTPFLVNETQAKEIVSRWMKGPSMEKNLDSEAEITTFTKILFPVYRFRRMVGGQEEVYIRPARATFIEGMQEMVLPPGTMKIYDESVAIEDALRLDPEMAMDAYLEELPGEPMEHALVFVPFYQVEYNFQNQVWHAAIDGSTGAMHASLYPVRSSMPFGIVFITGFLAGMAGLLLGLYVHQAIYLLVPLGVAGSWYLAQTLIRQGEQKKSEG